MVKTAPETTCDELAPMDWMMTFSRIVDLAAEERRQPDGQDGDGDGRLDALTDLEREIGRGHGEDRAEDEPQGDRRVR